MRTAILTAAHEDGSGEPWTETYPENDGTVRGLKPEIVDVEAWARGLIDYFNETIQDPRREKRRKFISVSVTDDGKTVDIRRPHEWRKTNLVTIFSRGRTFDTLACGRCGITAKRFGVSFIKRDTQFRAKKYEVCR